MSDRTVPPTDELCPRCGQPLYDFMGDELCLECDLEADDEGVLHYKVSQKQPAKETN